MHLHNCRQGSERSGGKGGSLSNEIEVELAAVLYGGLLRSFPSGVDVLMT